MVQIPRQIHLVKPAPSEFADLLNRDQVEVEVVQSILLLELARVTEARLADIHCGDSGIRLAKEGDPCGLGRAATGDEDFLVSPERFGWPHQVVVRPPPIRILVEIAVLVEAGERRRVRNPLSRTPALPRRPPPCSSVPGRVRSSSERVTGQMAHAGECPAWAGKAACCLELLRALVGGSHSPVVIRVRAPSTPGASPRQG